MPVLNYENISGPLQCQVGFGRQSTTATQSNWKASNYQSTAISSFSSSNLQRTLNEDKNAHWGCCLKQRESGGLLGQEILSPRAKPQITSFCC
jgi:hypothetical protein